MKKRLWVLILCLVMVASLLPVAAMADSWMDPETGIGVQGIGLCGTNHGDTYFSVVLPPHSSLFGDVQGFTVDKTTPIPISRESDGRYKIPRNSQIVMIHFRVSYGPSALLKYYIPLNHDWQFTQMDSTLTGKCQNDSCPIRKVSVELKANSVTLPESPFKAQLVGWEQFKKEVPDAVIGEFVYKYKAPGDSEYHIVEPTAANAKAGEYQVGVRISGLPGTVEQAPGAATRAAAGNQDSSGYADLYVQYTVADPAITAQTGDNRPIEIMMASVLVFSALAAAAFILDNKRKYSR